MYVYYNVRNDTVNFGSFPTVFTSEVMVIMNPRIKVVLTTAVLLAAVIGLVCQAQNMIRDVRDGGYRAGYAKGRSDGRGKPAFKMPGDPRGILWFDRETGEALLERPIGGGERMFVRVSKDHFHDATPPASPAAPIGPKGI